MNSHEFCIAPMIDYSHRHFRFFLRLLTKHALLYTEMLTTQALLKGKSEHLLAFNREEHPIACQLGGHSPKDLALSAKMVANFGYDEVNLNVGCPSNRVQSGAFGAVLMKKPMLVADCIKAMQDAVSLPVTVKCRIGVDDFDSDAFFFHFIDTVSKETNTFIIHARKAWLKGLSPKQNRTIPPLNYALALRLKKERPFLKIILNGGIENIATRFDYPSLDGVMLGRKAINDPYHFSRLDQYFAKEITPPSRETILSQYFPYLKKEYQSGVNLSLLLKPLFGLFHGLPGGKKIKQQLTLIPGANNPLAELEQLLLNRPIDGFSAL